MSDTSSRERRLQSHLDHFETLYQSAADPWRAKVSRAEAHKRSVIGRVLGARRGVGVEIGSGNGVSTVHLAYRFYNLFALDGSQTALNRAREITDNRRNIKLVHAVFPCTLPPADTVVASEILYYLPTRARGEMLKQISDALRPHGRLISVNHLRRFDDAECSLTQLTIETCRVFGPPTRSIVGAGWRCDVYQRKQARSAT